METILNKLGFITIFIGIVIVIISNKDTTIKSAPWVFLAYIFSWIVFLLTLLIFNQLNVIKLY